MSTSKDKPKEPKEPKKPLSEEAIKAKNRPSNFYQLSGEEQWAIDKALGILDWDGN